MINLVSVSLVLSFCFLFHLLFTGDWPRGGGEVGWSWLHLSGVCSALKRQLQIWDQEGIFLSWTGKGPLEISCHLLWLLGTVGTGSFQPQ